MRWLEVRRHSLTKKGAARGRGSHLSAEGVALARRIGAEVRAPAYVLTSEVPRCVETAVAMGFAVDDTVSFRYPYVDGEVGRHEQWTWDEPFVRYAALLGAGGGVATLVAEELPLVTAAVERVDDGAAALVVTHGGTIEPLLVGCLPGADHRSWGPAIGHGEGATLTWEHGRFTSIELRRVG